MVRLAYFLGAGGLLPRCLPDGALGTLLGQFGLLLLMLFLQKVPRKNGVRGLGAYLADACYKRLEGWCA